MKYELNINTFCIQCLQICNTKTLCLCPLLLKHFLNVLWYSWLNQWRQNFQKRTLRYTRPTVLNFLFMLRLQSGKQVSEVWITHSFKLLKIRRANKYRSWNVTTHFVKRRFIFKKQTNKTSTVKVLNSMI